MNYLSDMYIVAITVYTPAVLLPEIPYLSSSGEGSGAIFTYRPIKIYNVDVPFYIIYIKIIDINYIIIDYIVMVANIK